MERITDDCIAGSFETAHGSSSVRRTRTIVASREVEAGPAFDVYKGVNSTRLNASHLGEVATS